MGSEETTPLELLHVSKDVYSLDAIKRAVYRHANRGAFDIRTENGHFSVTFQPKDRMDPISWSEFRHKFLTDVLDEDLRKSIREETVDLRNLILAHAFSKSNLTT